MSLGAPRTRKFPIGTAELRIGPLSLANRLTAAHSVGLIDSVTVEVSQESVNLEGGMPRKLIDTAIVSQSSKISGQIREYSRRNLKVMLGEGTDASPPTDVETTVASNATAGATTLTVTSAVGFAQGDIAVIYPSSDAGQVSVCLIASIAGNVITMDADTPLLYAAASGAKVFNGQPVKIGGVAETNYLSAMIIQTDRVKKRPLVFNFWKVAIASGMNFATGTTEFGSTGLELNCLEPAASEYGVGGDLIHLADLIPGYPIGMMIGGADY